MQLKIILEVEKTRKFDFKINPFDYNEFHNVFNTTDLKL